MHYYLVYCTNLPFLTHCASVTNLCVSRLVCLWISSEISHADMTVFVTFNLGEDPGNIFVVYFMGKSLLRQASSNSNSTTSPWPSFLNERLSAAAVRSYLPSLAEEKYTLGMAGEENRKGGRPKLWQTTMLRTFWNRTLLILQPLLTSQKKP